MNEYSMSDYNIFNDAISNVNTLNESIETSQSNIKSCQSQLCNESVFMGPIADSCKEEFAKVELQISSMKENFTSIANYLSSAVADYKAADEKAKKAITDINNESTNKKDINTKDVKAGSKVANALAKYKDELENAEYAKVGKNIFTTTTTEYINGKPVKVTHVVINDPSQIKGASANGAYANGKETASSAAQRLNSSILINGSHFSLDDNTGRQDLKGDNHIVIFDGKIINDGTSGGNELLLDKNGNIYNAKGKSAQELVDAGVQYSYSCHSVPVIVNGDTSRSYEEGNLKNRTIIGQSAPGEYYIVTDESTNNRLSDTAEYLANKGVQNAFSMDQGGSVSLVRDQTVINKPSDGKERPVGDFLYFTA